MGIDSFLLPGFELLIIFFGVMKKTIPRNRRGFDVDLSCME